MKSMILTALFLVGFSASAQSACQASSETLQGIDSTNNSTMMAKPKMNVIRAFIATDECLMKYLKVGDATHLAQAILELKVNSSAEILSSFVGQAEAKMRTEAPKACQAAAGTLENVEQIAGLGMHVKARYVTVKGLLAADECLSSGLSLSELAALSQRIVFESADSLAIQMMISDALAH